MMTHPWRSALPLLFACMISPFLFGKTITSAVSGKWSSPAVWQGNTLPSPADSVIIAAGDSVTVDANDTVATLTVQSGGVVLFDGKVGRILMSLNSITVDAGGAIVPSVPFESGYADNDLVTGGDLTVHGTIKDTVNGASGGARSIRYVTMESFFGKSGNAVIGGSGTIGAKSLVIAKHLATDTVVIGAGLTVRTTFIRVHRGTLDNRKNLITTNVVQRDDNASRFLARPAAATGLSAAYYFGGGEIVTGFELPDSVDILSVDSLTVCSLTKDLVAKQNSNLTDGGRVITGKFTLTSPVVGNFSISLPKGFVQGALAKPVAVKGDSVRTFEVGTATGLGDARFAFASLSPGGVLTVRSNGTAHPAMADTAAALRRWWSCTASGSFAFSSYTVTVRYSAKDFPAGTSESANESSLLVGLYDRDASSWTFPAVTQRDTSGPGGTVTVSGLKFFGDLVLVTQKSALSAPSSNDATPASFALEQNFPNPFNPSTTIRYSIPNGGRVTLTIYDMLGRAVRQLVDGVQERGEHSAVLTSERMSSGTYVASLRFADRVVNRTIVLIK